MGLGGDTPLSPASPPGTKGPLSPAPTTPLSPASLPQAREESLPPPLGPTWADGLQVPGGEAIERGIQQQNARNLRQAEDVGRRPSAHVVPLRALALLLQRRQGLAAEPKGHRRQQALRRGQVR